MKDIFKGVRDWFREDVRHAIIAALSGIILVLILVCPADAAAKEVTLSQESVDAVAATLSFVVDEQAAKLNQYTQPDIWADAGDHALVTAIYIVVATFLWLFAGALIRFGGEKMGVIPSSDEIKDAAELVRKGWTYRQMGQELPPDLAEAEKQSGLILLSASVVTAAYILGGFLFIAAVSTPHG